MGVYQLNTQRPAFAVSFEGRFVAGIHKTPEIALGKAYDAGCAVWDVSIGRTRLTDGAKLVKIGAIDMDAVYRNQKGGSR